MPAPLRFLYVDDESDLFEIAKIFPRRGGAFAVDTVTSAGEAPTRLKTERYDMIVSGYQMPEMELTGNVTWQLMGTVEMKLNGGTFIP